MQGFFDDRGQIFFDIELVGIDGEVISVDALLDTGFTDWIAMNEQDINSLGWSLIRPYEMQTARGRGIFYVYQGTVIFDGQTYNIPVLGCEEISEVLLGLSWLDRRRLVVDRSQNLLTLVTSSLS